MGRKTCIKCGKGVSVLVCKSSNCPVAIHENCIPSLQVHNRENFCCPYCVYKQSVAEYQQAKDKALLAQRKLSMFLGTKTFENKDFDPNITIDKCTVWQNHKEFGKQERMVKWKEGWHFLRAENDPKVGKCSLVHVRGMPSAEGAALSALDKKRGYVKKCKGNLKLARCINGIKLVEDQKKFGSQSCGNLCSKVEDEVLTVDSMRACEKGTTVVEYHYETPMPLSVAGGELVQFHQPMHNFVCENEIFTHDQQHLEPLYYCNMEKGMQLEPSPCNLWEKNKERRELAETNLFKAENKWHREWGLYETATCSMSKVDRAEIYEQSDSGNVMYISGNYKTETYAKIARQSIWKIIETKNFNQPGKVSDKPSGSEVCCCNDPNIVSSSNAGWIDKPSKKIMNGFAFDARRKRLRWTTEEEEMLKKGVLIYSMGVKKNLPWRKILEFGCHVFDRSRTTSDLKTKWKIISRKEHLELNED